MSQRPQHPIRALRVHRFRVPTDGLEQDGTFTWQATILVLVELEAAGVHALGYTYADLACATLIETVLKAQVLGQEALDIPRIGLRMVQAVRNLGRPGVASEAISAVDNALWDLKGKLLNQPVAALIGLARSSVPIYGSGGFTSYSLERLQEQLSGWAEMGFRRVKIKVGRHPEQDSRRLEVARQAIGRDVALMVDANGAFGRKEALDWAERYTQWGVDYFEEPVSADDLAGLRLIRDRAPAGMAIAAGEYGYDSPYFRRMLENQAVDILQADATRCLGISGFLKAGALAEAFMLPLSAHCAPAIHVHPACGLPALIHLEYFHDHARLEQRLFDGVPIPVAGMVHPDRTRPGLGLSFKWRDAERYAV